MADKEIKKRKRQSNGVQTPNKKVAFDSGDGEKIRVAFVEDEKLHPVLLSAPGVNAPKLPFKAYAKARKETAGGGIKPKTHDLLLHSSQHPRLNYTAASSISNLPLSHYVAVYDPATKQLQVAPAHYLGLRTTLRSEQEEVERDSLTNAQRREELGREFGTKKAKKAIASKTENAIVQDTKGKGKVTDVQTAILESVADATAGAAKKNTQHEADILFSAKPIPKPNLAAETVETVYTFNTLLPYDAARLVMVVDWQDKGRSDKTVNFNHRFPAGRFKAIAKGDDLNKLKALRYLTLLLEFNDALGNAGHGGGKKVPKKDVLSKKLTAWPQGLVDSVRRRFTNDSGSELGKWQMDNFHTHIAALALYIDGWSTNTHDLKEDLRLEMRQMTQYYQELGCKVYALTDSERTAGKIPPALARNMKMAKLKLPLEFPKVRTGRRT